MFETIRNAFGNAEQKQSEQERPNRPSATIRAELGVARDSVDALRPKLDAAARQVLDEQESYDAQMRSYALGSEPEPDRGALAAAVGKAGALRRISQELQRTTAKLESELSAVLLAEAVAAGQERLSPLVTHAEAKLAEFEQCILAAKKSETELFALLFDEQHGLKQRFAGVGSEAQKARFRINNRAQEAARKSGYQLNPDFETDGLVNLGAREAGIRWFHQFSGGVENAILQQRMDAAADSVGLPRRK